MVVLVSMRVLKATPSVSMMAAAHFAVHPIHTEAVTGVVGRADVLSALFFLSSLYFYSRCISDESQNASSTPSSPVTPSTPPTTSSDSNPSSPVRDLNFNDLNSSPSSSSPKLHIHPDSKPLAPNCRLQRLSSQQTSCRHFSLDLVISLFLAGVAVFCKETGITVLGVALIYDLTLNRAIILRALRTREFTKEWRACLIRLVCVCLWIASILALRMWIMDFKQPKFKAEDNPAAEAQSRLTRFLTFLYLPAFNLWLLLFPATLSYDWAVGSIPLVTSIGDPRNVWSASFYVVLLVLVWYSIHHLSSQSTKSLREMRTSKRTNVSNVSVGFVCSMALAMTCVPFLPATNLFFKVGFVVAERVLYIPSIGFSLLVAQGVSSLWTRLPCLRVLVTLTAVALLMLLGVRTAHRNMDWHSRRALFWSGVKSLPHNAKMHYNMANLLRDEGDSDTATLHYRRAISLYPIHPSYHLNLGAVLSNRSEAELCYQETLRLNPGHTGALVNLASLWIEDGKVPQGKELLQQALDLDPNHAEALLTMGKTLLDHNETVRAGKLIKRAMLFRRNWATAHLYYAAFLQFTDDLEGALREYLRVLDLDPAEGSAMNNAARILISFGRYEEAEPLLKRALDVDPSCSDCLSVLATSYSRQGQHTQAVVTLGHASSLAPNDTSITLKYVQALKQSKQSKKAQAVLQKLLHRVPDDLTALTFAYNYAMEEERLVDASHYIKDAVLVAEQTKHQSLSKLYFEQGEIFRHYQDYDNSLKFYKKSIRQDNRHTQAIVSAGSVLYLKKNYFEAEVYYLKALELDPGNRLAKLNLAKLRKLLTDEDLNT
ncbi:transmembrane and tpr repeat-containing protein 1 [Plakobranchus ocellatus]|uniref:dolichyl-phosphate-mannose--protein mannosyltransferase n=1 Tax=Plakobranchus ocellatus TaxID=259542 RepID=A0AAV4DDK5_9GAST|nr:transmembrane and tpr repeat-containing protein 1 [Plakobranchus ocellatus]